MLRPKPQFDVDQFIENTVIAFVFLAQAVIWWRLVRGSTSVWLFITSVTLALLLIWLARDRSVKVTKRTKVSATAPLRLRFARCPHCHYDLRNSFDRCPECGSDVRRDRTH